MATQARSAYGTLLRRGSSPAGSSPQAYTTLPDIKSISGPSTELSTLDVTTHASAASGNYREFIPSLIDPGQIDAEMNWDPNDATHKLLLTDFQNRTLRDWEIQTPANAAGQSANAKFQAYVVGFPQEFPTDEVMGVTLTLKLTGGYTVTAD